MIIVFLITGFWHGANWTFIIWGLAHGLFMIIERIGLSKILKKQSRIVSTLYTLIVVNITWAIFRSETIEQAKNYIVSMFSFKVSTNFDYLLFYLNKENIIIIVLGIILSTPIYKHINSFINQPENKTKMIVLESFKTICLIGLFIISCVYIASDTYNPFIYFRF